MTEPTLVAWILYDATADKKYIKMDPTNGSLAIFDSEEAAMAAKRLYPGTDYKRCEYYSTPQPTPNKLNADREQVTEVEAPSHSLPDWSECNLRVGNSEWLKDNSRKPEHDSLTATPLHEFIYEYDDSDTYKSAWFLHRLEKLIGFIKSEQVPTSDVSVLVEALERISKMDSMSYHSLESAKIVARKALAAHRKHEGKS